MAQFVLCKQKANKPRMDVRVCVARCPDAEVCPDLNSSLSAEEAARIAAECSRRAAEAAQSMQAA